MKLVKVCDDLSVGWKRKHLLEKTEQKPSHHQTGVVLDHTGKGHDKSPSRNDECDVPGGSLKSLQDYVTWDLCSKIG